MNLVDVILALAVVAAVVLAVRSLVRTRATGGCASCPYAGSCHKPVAGRESCKTQASAARPAAKQASEVSRG